MDECPQWIIQIHEDNKKVMQEYDAKIIEERERIIKKLDERLHQAIRDWMAKQKR